MKRSAQNRQDIEVDPSFHPKKKPTKKYVCVICKTPEDHLHRLNDAEAKTISKMYDKNIEPNSPACKRHWAPHPHVRRFTQKNRPKLLEATAYHTAPIKRKPPPKRIPTPPQSNDPATFPN